MSILKILGTLVIEEIAKDIWRRVNSGRRVKGSMYPFELPPEATPNKAPAQVPGTTQVFQQPRVSTPALADIQGMVIKYLGSPEAAAWQRQYSSILDKAYIERPGSGYNQYMAKAISDLKARAMQSILGDLGIA